MTDKHLYEEWWRRTAVSFDLKVQQDVEASLRQLRLYTAYTELVQLCCCVKHERLKEDLKATVLNRKRLRKVGIATYLKLPDNTV